VLSPRESGGGAILAAMDWVHAYFDRRCRKQSLNTPIVLVSSFSWTAAISFWMIQKYSSNGDNGGLYLGIFLAAISLVNVFIGFQSIHAVVRRLVVESRNTP
jgi:hypothetical protein